MSEQVISEAYWGKHSVGDRHWVGGQAYPASALEHYDTHRRVDFYADANVVYHGPAPGSGAVDGEQRWDVSTNPRQGDPNHFTLPISSGMLAEERYNHLVAGIEARLGGTGLKILVY